MNLCKFLIIALIDRISYHEMNVETIAIQYSYDYDLLTYSIQIDSLPQMLAQSINHRLIKEINRAKET